MWLWDKDPSGRYNTHSPLQLEEANKWIATILTIPALKSLKIEVTSHRWDHYSVNDSVLFFNLKNKERPNYHSYHTFAKQLDIAPEQLKKIILDFDKLGLNRFYREEHFIAFRTETSLSYSKGYFYFFDTAITNNINPADILNFEHEKDIKYFREALFNKFLVIKKYDDHWIEWKETN